MNVKIIAIIAALSFANAAVAASLTHEEKRAIILLKMAPETMSPKQDKELARWLAKNLYDHYEIDKILALAWGKR